MSWLTWWRKDEKKEEKKENKVIIVKESGFGVFYNENNNTLTLLYNEYSTNFLDQRVDESGCLLFDVYNEDSLSFLFNMYDSKYQNGFNTNIDIINITENVIGNNVTVQYTSKNITSVKIIYKHTEFVSPVTARREFSSDISPRYNVEDLYIINRSHTSLNNILTINLTCPNYNNLYLTNLKASTTHPATNVNIIVSGDITQCYTVLPDGVDTINAPALPGEYLQNESYMDLVTVTNVELTNFGVLNNGKFTSQKIYLTKIIVNESNKTKVENSKMESRNKSTTDDTYALTIVEVGDEETIVTNVTFPEDKPNIVRLELDGTESDLLDSYVSGSILTINLDNDLWQTFYNSGNTKSELELYMKQMVIKDNSKRVEFFRNGVWYIHIKYGTQYVEYDSNSFTTYLETLNITYTKNEEEEESSIQPITYSSNGNVKAIGLQSKDSYINYIETVNSINTLVIGDDNECIIGDNRITLVNDGCIPKKMYTDILPIGETEEHYVDSDGSIASSGVARLVAINEPPENEYLTYKSSMNLIDIKDVDLSKFGTTTGSGNQVKIDKQNVFLSSILVYDNEVNKKVGSAGLMSRNEQVITGGLGDGEVNYAPTNVELQRDDLVLSANNAGVNTENYRLELKLEDQITNKFLKSVTKSRITYTDVYLNATVSNQFVSCDKNCPVQLFMNIFKLLNQYELTFNGVGDMGNLRVHYIKSNPASGDTLDELGYVVYIPDTSQYRVTQLYVISGMYKNDTSNLIPIPVNWIDENDENEGTKNHCIFNRKEESGVVTMSIDLPYKEKLVNSLTKIGELYSVNTFTTNDPEKINLYLIVSGEIPQWVFKDLLPLPKSIDANNSITITDTGKSLYAINKPLESYVGVSSSAESTIDLTNVADLEVFNRVYLLGEKKIDSDGNDNKVFFVNKVKLLKRIEGKINIGDDVLFQYYDGMTRNPSAVEFVHDWALDLPECYESCEVSGTELTVKFGEYLQIDYKDGITINDYLFRKLYENESQRYYLDLSMKMNSNLNLDNITTLNVYLGILKYISWTNSVMLFKSGKICVIYNKNGFLENKVFEVDNINQKINYCYLIYETRENTEALNRDNILIEPISNALSLKNRVSLFDFFSAPVTNMTINNLECTNVYQTLDLTQFRKFPSNTKVNLLVSGVIPKWLGEYFYSEDKALPIKVKSGSCELVKSDGSTEVTDKYFMITSINALPAPGIGIANSDPDDQCNLNLEDFMPQPDSGGTGDDGDNPSGGTDPSGNDSTGGDDPSGGSTGD